MWHCMIALLLQIDFLSHAERCLLINNAFLLGEIQQEYTRVQSCTYSWQCHPILLQGSEPEAAYLRHCWLIFCWEAVFTFLNQNGIVYLQKDIQFRIAGILVALFSDKISHVKISDAASVKLNTRCKSVTVNFLAPYFGTVSFLSLSSSLLAFLQSRCCLPAQG